MEYSEKITLKDGRTCLLRNATREDAAAMLECFKETHRQTDYLLSYPDEKGFTVEEEGNFLEKTTKSDREIEIMALVNGKVTGLAGISLIRDREKTRHRADFGISVDQAYWRLGIGLALTKACIECAKKANYKQLELEAVSANDAALRLYERVGFREFGRNPKAFFTRQGTYQEVVLMRLELD